MRQPRAATSARCSTSKSCGDPVPLLALGATDGSLLARGRRLLRPAEDRAASPRLAASVIVLVGAALQSAVAAVRRRSTRRRRGVATADAGSTTGGHEQASAGRRGRLQTGAARPAPVVTVARYGRHARQPLGLGGARGAHAAARALLDWLQHLAGQDAAAIRLHRPLGDVTRATA